MKAQHEEAKNDEWVNGQISRATPAPQGVQLVCQLTTA